MTKWKIHHNSVHTAISKREACCVCMYQFYLAAHCSMLHIGGANSKLVHICVYADAPHKGTSKGSLHNAPPLAYKGIKNNLAWLQLEQSVIAAPNKSALEC